jgi:hypothetical protein
MGSMEYAIPSVGGFCVGTTFVVDHQRLSGLGKMIEESTEGFADNLTFF